LVDSIEWNMLFNLSKCKVLRLGYNNRQTEYYMNGHKLEVVTSEIYLGAIVDHTLKYSEQCTKAVNKANRTLGMIKRTFNNRSKSIIRTLYTSLVRPKLELEYCVQVWRPYLQEDIDQIENVHRRATKLIHGYSNKTYEERLKLLGLTPLETRRTRGYLIEVFKIIKGIDRKESSIFFLEIYNNHKRT
jgi:IS1 family transposase